MNHIDNPSIPAARDLGGATFSRRGVLASAALGALVARHVAAQEGTPAASADSNGGVATPSSLVVGIGDGLFDDFLFPLVEVYDSSFTRTGSIRVPDGVIDVFQTGDPNLALVSTFSATAILDLEAGELVSIDWGDIEWESDMTQWAFGATSAAFGETRNPEWIVSSGLEVSGVLAVNLTTRTGRDITEFVNQNNQDFVPAVPRYMPEGSLIGLWTGDNVYLVDLEKPEEARKLVGDDPNLFSTTIDIDPTGSWCAYTTYDATLETVAGRVYIESVSSGEYVEVTEGTAWSQVVFVPGDPESFLLVAGGEVQLRSIADPQTATEPLATIGELTHHQSFWDGTGTKYVLGTRPDQDAPATWILIDTSAKSVVELGELEGLDPLMVTAAQPAPSHCLFGYTEEEPGPVYGLDLETGEVNEYLPEVNLGSVPTYSSSEDGRWYFVMTENRGEVKGAWLVDNQAQVMHELPWGEGLYTLTGAVSPDGKAAAITTVARPSDDVTSSWISLDEPTTLQDLTDGHILAWS